MVSSQKTTLDFAPKWAAPVLLIAGIYNILWGAFAVLFPMAVFNVFHIDPPRYPELWQCIGMIVGVYGVGYIAAASDPLRYWPIVLVGFLGKVFGPIGFLKALWDGVFPIEFGVLILFNDIIWWLPFGLLLLITYDVAKNDRIARANGEKRLSPEKAMKKFKSTLNETVFEHSNESPVLLVFLRHAGCTFCREAMADIQKKRIGIETEGVLPILVDMMSDDQEAKRVYQKYHLADLPRVHDPERKLYRAMNLKRGGILQLLGPKTWFRGAQAAIFDRHGIGSLKGDGMQMPGVFLVEKGKIIKSYQHKSAADKVDYEELACSV